MLEAALFYAKMGWRVFPCEVKGKKPLIKEWQNKATTDDETIYAWWKKWPNANIGVATGMGSGIFVLDVDGEEGSRSLTDLENEIGALPDTLEAKTGSGGRHLIFEMTVRPLRNKQSFRPGLDIRAEGGYIIVAPSIHPDTGHAYEWPYGMNYAPIARAPKAFLDEICPIVKELPVEEPVKLPRRPQSTPVTDRALLYLQECEPATQGAGGHDALLWAARALVIGFEMSPSEAKAMLWNDFNPRCSPPWNRSKPDEIRDFERKVDQAVSTPGKKPRGWLLDECGLRAGEDTDIAFGRMLSAGLLQGSASIIQPKKATSSKPKVEIVAPRPPAEKAKFVPFPMGALPRAVADYGFKVAQAHDVDLSFVGLPLLVTTSAAMGNKFRLKLKERWLVPPTLWGGVVGESGSNKSAPMHDITEPMSETVDMTMLAEEELLLNPQGRCVVSDVTVAAAVKRLAMCPAGLFCKRDELARWLMSFDAHNRKESGDEQAWIEFHEGRSYQLDRKTDSEEVFIPAASVAVLGSIQPDILVKCFDPAKFASGLVPRILIAYPPDRGMPDWNDTEIEPEDQKRWHDIIMWLRTRPFASLDTNNQRFMPNIWTLSPTAKARLQDFFREIKDRAVNESKMFRTFASKSRGATAARLALNIHGMSIAQTKGVPNIWKDAEVSLQSMESSIEITRWLLNEQLRVYGLASVKYVKSEIEDLAVKITTQFGGSVLLRRFTRSNNRKYKNNREAKEDLNKLVEAGLGKWNATQDRFTVIKKED